MPEEIFRRAYLYIPSDFQRLLRNVGKWFQFPKNWRTDLENRQQDVSNPRRFNFSNSIWFRHSISELELDFEIVFGTKFSSFHLWHEDFQKPCSFIWFRDSFQVRKSQDTFKMRRKHHTPFDAQHRSCVARWVTCPPLHRQDGIRILEVFLFFNHGGDTVCRRNSDIFWKLQQSLGNWICAESISKSNKVSSVKNLVHYRHLRLTAGATGHRVHAVAEIRVSGVAQY